MTNLQEEYLQAFKEWKRDRDRNSSQYELLNELWYKMSALELEQLELHLKKEFREEKIKKENLKSGCRRN
jgi:ferric-dicitrate binding protein FerR (iron transport regulator)